MMNSKENRENKESFLKALAAGAKKFEKDFRGTSEASKAHLESITIGQRPIAVVINCRLAPARLTCSWHGAGRIVFGVFHRRDCPPAWR